MIKKVLFILLIPTQLFAQFPVTVTLAWNPNPLTELVTSYTVSIDNSPGSNVSALSRCDATECTTTIVVPTSGMHTIRVVAINMWGSSLPAELTFNANSPGRSGNIRIRVP